MLQHINGHNKMVRYIIPSNIERTPTMVDDSGLIVQRQGVTNVDTYVFNTGNLTYKSEFSMVEYIKSVKIIRNSPSWYDPY